MWYLTPWACEWSPGLVLVLIFQLTFFTYHLGGNGKVLFFVPQQAFNVCPLSLILCMGFVFHDGDGVPKCYPNMSVLTPPLNVTPSDNI